MIKSIDGCISEYGLKVSVSKSKVLCIHSEPRNRTWSIGDGYLEEVSEYKYLGVTVRAGTSGGFKSMGDRMKEANSILGMVKYAASRSGSRYVIGREGWKGVIVNKLMYGCGALAWYQSECDDLEVMQNTMGRWLWKVSNIRNELVRGETGWSSFEERETKAMVSCLLRLVFKNNIVSEIGRACLTEIGGNSRWWSRLRHLCGKYGLNDLVNLTWLGFINREGLERLNLSSSEKFWKKEVEKRIMTRGNNLWKRGFDIQKTSELEYVQHKVQPKNEEYANGTKGASVRLMVRGGCLQVRGNEYMRWKYEDTCCVCGEVETEGHVLYECTEYQDERRVWELNLREPLNDLSKSDVLKGYGMIEPHLDTLTLRFLTFLWAKRERNEKNRIG